MTDVLNAVADYMESTEALRRSTAIKIASLENTNKELSTANGAVSGAVEVLVSKMASAGIINDIQAAHLSTIAHNGRAAESVCKLNALLDDNASKKVATAPQLYTVEESTQESNKNNKSEIEASWMSKLRVLGSKA